MRSIDPESPNFLDKNNYHFKELHAAVDHLGRQLRMDCVGAEVKHASVITSEEEDALWENGVLSTENPKALLSAVFYCNGKNFCLRGACEHRNLKLSQLKRLYDSDRYMYHMYTLRTVLRIGLDASLNFLSVHLYIIFHLLYKKN